MEEGQELPLAQGAAYWGEAWLARVRGAPQGISRNSVTTWAIYNACTQAATVFPYRVE